MSDREPTTYPRVGYVPVDWLKWILGLFFIAFLAVAGAAWNDLNSDISMVRDDGRREFDALKAEINLIQSDIKAILERLPD